MAIFGKAGTVWATAYTLYQVIGNGAGAPLIGHIVFQMLAPAFLGGGLALWMAKAQHQHRLDYQQK